MRDAKHIHDELKRESFSYENGWTPEQSWIDGLLWGAVLVTAVLVFF